MDIFVSLFYALLFSSAVLTPTFNIFQVLNGNFCFNKRIVSSTDINRENFIRLFVMGSKGVDVSISELCNGDHLPKECSVSNETLTCTNLSKKYHQTVYDSNVACDCRSRKVVGKLDYISNIVMSNTTLYITPDRLANTTQFVCSLKSETMICALDYGFYRAFLIFSLTLFMLVFMIRVVTSVRSFYFLTSTRGSTLSKGVKDFLSKYNLIKYCNWKCNKPVYLPPGEEFYVLGKCVNDLNLAPDVSGGYVNGECGSYAIWYEEGLMSLIIDTQNSKENIKESVTTLEYTKIKFLVSNIFKGVPVVEEEKLSHILEPRRMLDLIKRGYFCEQRRHNSLQMFFGETSNEETQFGLKYQIPVTVIKVSKALQKIYTFVQINTLNKIVMHNHIFFGSLNLVNLVEGMSFCPIKPEGAKNTEWKIYLSDLKEILGNERRTFPKFKKFLPSRSLKKLREMESVEFMKVVVGLEAEEIFSKAKVPCPVEHSPPDNLDKFKLKGGKVDFSGMEDHFHGSVKVDAIRNTKESVLFMDRFFHPKVDPTNYGQVSQRKMEEMNFPKKKVFEYILSGEQRLVKFFYCKIEGTQHYSKDIEKERCCLKGIMHKNDVNLFRMIHLLKELRVKFNREFGLCANAVPELIRLTSYNKVSWNRVKSLIRPPDDSVGKMFNELKECFTKHINEDHEVLINVAEYIISCISSTALNDKSGKDVIYFCPYPAKLRILTSEAPEESSRSTVKTSEVSDPAPDEGNGQVKLEEGEEVFLKDKKSRSQFAKIKDKVLNSYGEFSRDLNKNTILSERVKRSITDQICRNLISNVKVVSDKVFGHYLYKLNRNKLSLGRRKPRFNISGVTIGYGSIGVKRSTNLKIVEMMGKEGTSTLAPIQETKVVKNTPKNLGLSKNAFLKCSCFDGMDKNWSALPLITNPIVRKRGEEIGLNDLLSNIGISEGFMEAEAEAQILMSEISEAARMKDKSKISIALRRLEQVIAASRVQ